MLLHLLCSTILHLWLLHYSLQLVDTGGAEKPTNWRCPPFGKFFNFGLNFENKAFFFTSIGCM